MKRLAYLIMAAAMIVSCNGEHTLKKEDVTVYFRLDTLATKGISVNEDCISDCCVMVYDANGNLIVGRYSPDGAVSSMSYQFARGASYTFYYVCNIGDITADPRFTAESGLASYQYRINDYSEIVNGQGAVPMSGQSGLVTVEDGVNVFINLTRCVALISILVDNSSLRNSSMTINSMKIKNSPSKVSLFEESHASSGDDCLNDGDRADSDDIILLNTGESVDFYMFENKQGELLSGNSSDRTKFFEDGSPNEEKCSYIEFTGSYHSTTGTITTGSFTYRFYLGGNVTSDFSICRNMHYQINISLTDNGVFNFDWRINTDIVMLPVTSLNIYPATYTFDEIGESTDLYAYVSPYTSHELGITWSSSDPSVVSVDDEGCITATGYGTAVITASLTDFSRFSATCDVTVSGNDEPVTPPSESPVMEVFAEFSEYTVHLNEPTRIETYLRREDNSVEPISCILYYDISSTGTGNFTCPEENTIIGEGVGDATMYFIYDGIRSQPVTIHII